MNPSRLVGVVSALRWVLPVVFCIAPAIWAGAAPIRVLLLSGQNNHDWSQTTPVLQRILERDGKFEVDVNDHPETCTAERFARYDVLLSNWNAWGPNAVTNWPQVTRKAFLDFVREGRGLVVVHAGSSSFYDWPEYQEASGGSWNLPQTGHGPVHGFEVRIADANHPITRGLAPFRTTDELWHRTGFQPGVHVLATAFSDEDRGGSGDDEPVAVTTRFGQGRSFYLVLGHDADSMQASGFQSLLIRGTEWAARGEVTIDGEDELAEEPRDVLNDTWVATDGLGRTLPTYLETGGPRADRTVGIFYFLWHGAHIQGGPYDVSRILAADPGAMRERDSPLWGPLHAPHHWGESIFGYYLTRDEAVLRKHAQMLSDAGVDVVIFDVTNQITYHDDYFELLRVWSEFRAARNRTPQVAFLAPFWDPSKVVRELWRDLYSRNLFRELWFEWEGRPLLLADPELLDARESFSEQDVPAELKFGETLGQRFTADKLLAGVGGRFPTWNTAGTAVTLALYRDEPEGECVASQRFENIPDNAWLMLRLDPHQPAGTYYLEASEPYGKVGWWSHSQNTQPLGQAMAMRRPVGGDRTLRLARADDEIAAIRELFTFRKPQPDYFQGPTQPDMWSWLEVHPQHVFRNGRGKKEQMSVGVAQNAVGKRLGSMSEPGARGRSWRAGAMDRSPGGVSRGLNFQEQWDRALEVDPRFVFVTGWNEWIAGRFSEFNGIRYPIMFVDQFDQEHSRDIEPMRGGHGDNYYFQLVSNVRRYKGVRPVPPVQLAPIQINGRFDDWTTVQPEFRDTIGDPVQREHRGWDPQVVYRNDTGRNDIVAAKMSGDSQQLFCQVRTRAHLTPSSDAGWMVLFLDVDGSASSGWLGYDFVVNLGKVGELQRHRGEGLGWAPVQTVSWKQASSELELSIPWSALGLDGPPSVIDFKWADNVPFSGDWSEFTLHGDVAPNDRFNYRALLGP